MQVKGMPGVEATLAQETNARRTYSVAEVAERWGVHPATVYRMATSGQLKAIRIGAKRGTVRIPIVAVEEYENGASAAVA